MRPDAVVYYWCLVVDVMRISGGRPCLPIITVAGTVNTISRSSSRSTTIRSPSALVAVRLRLERSSRQCPSNSRAMASIGPIPRRIQDLPPSDLRAISVRSPFPRRQGAESEIAPTPCREAAVLCGRRMTGAGSLLPGHSC